MASLDWQLQATLPILHKTAAVLRMLTGVGLRPEGVWVLKRPCRQRPFVFASTISHKWRDRACSQDCPTSGQLLQHCC